MGSSGSGKSTIGQVLSQKLGASFVEGDDLHTAENKAKMASGSPLTDDDRWPWLMHLGDRLGQSEGKVIASCSALKKVYRRCISDHANEPVLYVYLHGSENVLATRLFNRKNHFMNAALLESQLDTLEEPGPDEFSVSINIDQPVSEIADYLLDLLS
jgi:carbohydrate kinase (thermoresistant glucokinase family)